MEKATTLMVGDWIYRPDCNDRVTEIRENGIIGTDKLRGLIGFNELKPIILTGEILEKNGFSRIDDSTYVFSRTAGDGYVKIRLQEIDDTEWDVLLENYDKFSDSMTKVTIDECNLLSVHELQHIINVCGINKEIQL